MKKWLERFIQRLAEVNEREYGDSVPDCCADGAPKKPQVEKSEKH